MEENIRNVPSFDKTMYGALLRHKRIEVGYRKAEDFISDLDSIGFKISRAALYRIERGEQEPAASFLIATSIVLYGKTLSTDLVSPCVPPDWADPLSSDSVLRVISKNGVLSSIKQEKSETESERASRYDEIMSGINSFDFSIFPNANSNEDHLYVSVAFGSEHDGDYEEIESYEITEESDIERAIIHFLKSYNFDLPGEEIVKLVDYGIKKIKPALADYQ